MPSSRARAHTHTRNRCCQDRAESRALIEIHAKHNAVGFRRDIGRKFPNKERTATDQLTRYR